MDAGMEKIRRVCAELEKKGVKRYACAPPAFRLMWQLGWPVPPPLYLPFATLALFSGAMFALLWGGLMWLFFWSQQPWLFRPSIAAVASLAAGVLFGLAIAGLTRWQARRLGLGAWRDA